MKGGVYLLSFLITAALKDGITPSYRQEKEAQKGEIIFLSDSANEQLLILIII